MISRLLLSLKRHYWKMRAPARSPTLPAHPEAARTRVHPALRFGCDLVLDVGANTGQYGKRLRELGYRGRIISFEPLSDAHAELSARAEGDALWEVHPRCAVGATLGSGNLNIAANSVSSSLLPMLDLHAEAAPESVYQGTQVTPIITLDSLLDSHIRPSGKPYLKIDTQGYEAQVLAGACDALRLVHAVEIELSLAPLYAEQKTWRYFIDLLEDAGFTLWELRHAFSDPRNGRVLQLDAVFSRGNG